MTSGVVPYHTIGVNFLAGWFGGAAGIIASHPLDIARVRIQVADSSRGPPSMYSALVKLLKEGGTQALTRGIVSPVLSVGLWKAFIFAATEKTKSAMGGDKVQLTLPQEAFAGAVGGAAGTVIQVPLENVKNRAQIHTGMPTMRFEMEVAARLYATHGWRGFFKGYVASWSCSPTSYAVWFGLNEQYLQLWKQVFILEQGQEVGNFGEACCAALSGSCAWVFAYPGDKMKAVFIASDAKTYRECFVPRFQAEGLQFLFRGLLASIVRGVPQCVFTMCGYKWSKKCLEG